MVELEISVVAGREGGNERVLRRRVFSWFRFGGEVSIGSGRGAEGEVIETSIGVGRFVLGVVACEFEVEERIKGGGESSGG